MVNLLLVSHSKKLAEGVAGLARQMSSDTVQIAVAAGVGENRQAFGTDAVEIAERIQDIYTDEGVLILMDLGSAILSAEMALELLPPEMHEKIRFCPAPFVEGAIAAGVQAGLGSSLEMVYQEAVGALLPKREQLKGSLTPLAEETAPEPGQPSAGQDGLEAILTVHSLHGLHARPAAKFVQTAASFDAEVKVKNLATNKGPVSAKSLNAIATLGVLKDHQIQVFAAGRQREEVVEALTELVEENFGEPLVEEQPPAKAEPKPQPFLKDERAQVFVPISEGVAIGPIAQFVKKPLTIPDHKVENPDVAWKWFESALEKVKQAIAQRRRDLAQKVGEADASILDAHLLILQDPDLLSKTRELIYQDHNNAAAAWKRCIEELVENYRALPDKYMQQRAMDVQGIGDEVLFELVGETPEISIQSDEPVILFAEDITPTVTSQLDLDQVLGLVTVGGGPTSHSAILARALGIPALSGADPGLGNIAKGTCVVVNGFTGQFWVDPPEDVLEESATRRQEWLEKRADLLKNSAAPAVMLDGRKVEVAANIGNVADARAAVKNGAEGVGLLRTEFLYLSRETAPTEEEQLELLQQIGGVMADLPVIVRTLDVGGDKNLPYIQLPQEANPFLGVRALRLSLREPELFRTQLRAILRAGKDTYYRIMFPMVASPEEFVQAKEQLALAHKSLLEEGLEHRWPIETGIMVEIPSAAILSGIFSSQVDFFSIGTNDLTQYTLAAERGNPELARLADALHPAVLNLVHTVAEQAHQHGKWVGVCGELAGDLTAIPVLVGIGVDELSMNPVAVPAAKSLIRKLDTKMLMPLAESVLAAENVEDVRRLARDFLQQIQ